ncbi:hypothetical protein FGO68_gene3499 [Halteria grandinella]|uniref:DUSP domain-containing protein n=1 Tax=Halteria grandinella TaxID=5974 RepID=A0A8J8T5V7_HALGN|nr:hypothetical protein FGO68_gene3499 [Halteria grandinella]
MTKIIEDQKNHLVNNFRPQIGLEDISIALQLRESTYDKFEHLLETACGLVMDNLKDKETEEDLTQLTDIIDKERFWLCISCNKSMTFDSIFCESCQVFKPLEMYKNILTDPVNATDEEILQLNERRKQEKQLIIERDMEKPESSPSYQQQQYWFMISSDWLYRWKCFVSNKVSSGASIESQAQLRRSESEKIGILPPGPISNDSLFEKVGDVMRVRRGLELNVDYRGVPREVWQIFHRMYGGGPPIVREDLDIYSQDLSSELTMKRLSTKRNSNRKPGGATNIFASGSSKNSNFSSAAAQPLPASQDKSQVLKSIQPKKRNLFQSENIGADDEFMDPGIPDESLEHNLNKQQAPMKVSNLKQLANPGSYQHQAAAPNQMPIAVRSQMLPNDQGGDIIRQQQQPIIGGEGQVRKQPQVIRLAKLLSMSKEGSGQQSSNNNKNI